MAERNRPFERVLIANRGAIAVRIARSVRALGLGAVGVYSDADRASAHVDAMDVAVLLPGERATDTYLNVPAILEAARAQGAGAIHPGYGFLAENPAFADACEAAGIRFLGPRPDTMRAFGLKDAARTLAQQASVPVLTGSELLPDVDAALAEATRIGYPVMLKSTAGGGGIGMQVCQDDAQLRDAFASVTRLARSSFGDAGLILERFVANARHVEVQVFGDGEGHVCILGDRDCSLQRRNQKVVEEAPAPALPDHVRAGMHDAARRLLASVSYRSAGTVEFLYDADAEAYYFLEVNARLQVEHGVTELVTGVDIVDWMLQLELGTLGDALRADPVTTGAAIQARVYAEDPLADCRPSTGLVTRVVWPEIQDGRIDTWVRAGATVSSHYDPMLAKVLVHAADRGSAIAGLSAALAGTRIDGVQTNLRWLVDVLALPSFAIATHGTRTLSTLRTTEAAMEVLEPGTFTTVQAWPGRVGYWDIGVPPSGPMDPLSFRLGNRLLGNAADAAGLEFTADGASLAFRCDARVVLAGADFDARLDGESVPRWMVLSIAAGQVLRLGAAHDGGLRGYLLVEGGIDVPDYLGSAATFTLGQFGGHAGRALRAGDVLPIRAAASLDARCTCLSSALQPVLRDQWTLRVLVGPHAAPDFLTERGMAELLGANWEVHFQSSRTGVRLIGPKPDWAREDGGDAGLHPSNLHDNAYAIGAVDFTGDMPVILGPDGPSLGGFVCPFTVIAADQWQLGQLRPGDHVRFVAVSFDDSVAAQARQDELIESLRASPEPLVRARPLAAALRQPALGQPVLQRLGEGDALLVVRASGERNLLIEAGPAELDLRQRFRIERLQRALAAAAPRGMHELTAGVRSLQVQFDPQVLPRAQLIGLVGELDADVRNGTASEAANRVDARIVHLPLSWDDPAVQLAIERYMRVVRADAPWCPSNIEFIRRINGLADEAEVQRIVFDASYVVLGLGDVYLGAPVATPLDPRHRLVTTKYNPARTWTPENAVGIGGAYMCVYGMEGPGGYQFVGRTVQMWNRFPGGAAPAARAPAGFSANAREDALWANPWLLRTFDQVRFHPVSAAELLEMRAAFPQGGYTPRIEATAFDLGEYERTLASNAGSIAAFRTQQQAAFAAERERWGALGAVEVEAPAASLGMDASTVPANGVRVLANVAGVVAAVEAAPGADLDSGARLCVIESMKMEIPVLVPSAGRVGGVLVQRGDTVHAGQVLAWLDAA